jgi:hypothetical protein
MKLLIPLFIALSCLSTFAQNPQTIELKWKLGKNEKLNYATVMNEIDTSSIEFNFGGIFKALSDSTKNGLTESKDLFKKLNQAFKDQDFVTTLSTSGNGIINIIMTAKPKEPAKRSGKDTADSKADELMKSIESMNQGVMLRGSVYETGGIHSFWVKSSQKNLIALFFELPTRSVKIGDKWPLDIDLIANDQNFDCDSSFKLNEVTLTDIRTTNGETIAVLKYNIVEYVKGNFYAPLFLGNDESHKETMMKFTDQGIAEFSVDKGRWVSYDGIMSLEATGVMTANKKTKFTLINTGR